MQLPKGFWYGGFWGTVGLTIGFLGSMVANYPGNAVDRFWSDVFDCDQRFIEIAYQSIELRKSGTLTNERLSSYSNAVERYASLCGRIGTFDMHQALSSVDRRLHSSGYRADENFEDRLCFGEMISLMKITSAEWPEYMKLHEENLSFCRRRQE